jgi:endonuclease/exonuclease/phosphatase family metal-dependent hydrolase
LSEADEVFCDARQSSRASLIVRFQGWAGRLQRLPGLRALRPAAQRLAAVAEPVGRAFVRARPERRARTPSEVVTVLSANLWHDWPRHRRLSDRLEGLARLIEQEAVDVALLQEVARTPEIHVDEWLADRLGMAYVYTRANGHEMGIGFEEGLAVFSRYPLREPRVRDLEPTSTPFVHRVALGADVHTPGGAMAAYSVHLGLLPWRNSAQLDCLRGWVATGSRGRSAVIGGDFNAHERTRQIVRAQGTWLDIFRHIHPIADGTTHELRLPWGGRALRSRLDYLFLKADGQRWKVLEAQHLDSPTGPHSDHRAVLARLAPEA